MKTWEVLALVTCGQELVIALLCVRRARSTGLASLLAGLCFLCFVWNFAAWASSVSGLIEWSYLDWSLSPFTTVMFMDLALRFMGQRRRYRNILRLTYALTTVLSATTASAFVLESGRGFAGSDVWGALHIAIIVPGLGFIAVLLVRYLRAQTNDEERMRARLMLAVLVIGAIMGPVEILLQTDALVPSTLITSSLLAAVVLRFRLLDSEMAALSVAYTVGVALVAMLVTVQVFRAAQAPAAIFTVALLGVVAIAASVLRPALSDVLRQRGQIDRLATLGRLSAQMAHDLKNPLAAVKGAAQFLKEERAQGRSIDDQSVFLDLLVTEIDRLSRLIDRYKRLGELELVREPVAIEVLARRALSLQMLRDRPALEIRTAFAPDLPVCSLDADLLHVALENVLVNAAESMPDGGVLELSATTERHGEHLEIVIAVQDHGSGMSARTRERALDEFFTTKTHGSGLGLPLVRRVVEAHRGRLHIVSELGRGTCISFHLPVDV